MRLNIYIYCFSCSKYLYIYLIPAILILSFLVYSSDALILWPFRIRLIVGEWLSGRDGSVFLSLFTGKIASDVGVFSVVENLVA